MPPRLERLSAWLVVEPGDALLDYGCAEAPYRAFFDAAVEYTPADLPGNPHATLILNDDGAIPAPDDSFDAVLSTQVLEHVSDPSHYLAEAYRVLRPGGRILLSTHGTFVYHPDPVDLWRWTCDGLRRTVAAPGFEIEHFEGIIGLAATGLQLVQDAVYYHLPRPLRPALALVVQSLMAVADRIESADSRDMNGSVFALIARKPSVR